MRAAVRGSRVGGRQGGRRQDPVQVAQDRLRLVEGEAVVFEHRHLAERLALEMSPPLLVAGRERHETPGCAFLLQSRQDSAGVRAARNGVNDES